jgi:uncharacterized protein
MKKLCSILLLLCCTLVQAQKSITRPNPPRLVVDNANLLSPHDRDVLERKLVALDVNTSNQIAVVTVPSLNGEVLEEVAVNTYRDWGIGNKKTNNGVLVLIAVEDKAIRIEVGYGLEGAIPDVVAKDIINNDLQPAFRQGSYYSGINKAVDDLAKAAAGEYNVKRTKKSKGVGIGGVLVAIIVIIAVLAGGGGGGRGRRRSSWWVGPMIFNSGGFGGGGSSGGGFGGFGGGSSGGGGASGGW